MNKIKMTVGQAIVKFLNNQYVELDGVENQFVDGVYAIFGHGNVAGLGQALEEDPGHLRVYQGRNEQGMAHTCMSYAKQNNRRRIIAATSSVGPGAANMVTAAATATVNNVPLLLFPGDTFATRQPDPVLQQVEQSSDLSLTTNDAFKPVVKYWDRISRPEMLMPAMVNAMRVLTSPADAGAVCIALPQDVQGESFEFPEYFFQKRVHHIPRNCADNYELNKAVEMISAAKRPLIIAGGGVRYSEAGEVVMDFAKKFNIPVTQTQGGRSCLPDSFELAVGGIGVTGGLAGNLLAKDADLIIGIGTRFNDFVTGSKWVLFRNPDIKVLAINASPYHAEKLDATRVIGDAKVTVEALTALLADKGYKSGYADGEIAAIRDKWEVERQRVMHTEYKGEGFGEGKFVPEVPNWTDKIMNDFINDIGGTVTMTGALGILREECDPDAIAVAAAGSIPADMERLWVTDAKDSYNMEYGFSCMGWEIAAALGSKLACPDKEVYALVGDGSFLMLNSEIASAIQEGAKITVIVLDNTAFGCINNLQMGNGIGTLATEMRYRTESGKLDGKYVYTNFAKIGEGYGMVPFEAKNQDELREAIRAAKKETKSCIIDAKTLPKTMSAGYESWWHFGVASSSSKPEVLEARKDIDNHLAEARMY